MDSGFNDISRTAKRSTDGHESIVVLDVPADRTGEGAGMVGSGDRRVRSIHLPYIHEAPRVCDRGYPFSSRRGDRR